MWEAVQSQNGGKEGGQDWNRGSMGRGGSAALQTGPWGGAVGSAVWQSGQGGRIGTLENQFCQPL